MLTKDNFLSTKPIKEINKKTKIEFDTDVLPSALHISTITITCKFDSLINIENVERYIDLSPNGLLSIPDGNGGIRTVIDLSNTEKKKQEKVNSKKKVKFYNQTSIYIYVNDETKVNLKLFQNSSIQICGCKSIHVFNQVMNTLCTELTKKKMVYDKNNKILTEKIMVTNPENIGMDKILDFKIRMINSNFHVGFLINLEVFFVKLKNRGVTCFFEPSSHSCVSIKYKYTVSGVIEDIISLFIFESGCIIITAAKSTSHILKTYAFIINALFDNYKDIVKNNIEDIMKNEEIAKLIKC
jgi:TATA-box binding protein (TBP) (component of TFIID and TFIIIB)